MLFRRSFAEAIERGDVTATVRAWSRPQARVGGLYRFGGQGRIEVTALDTLPLSELRPADARRSGFADLDALRAELRRGSRRQLTPRSVVYRVRFRHRPEVAAEPPSDAERIPTPAERETLLAKLDAMDARSARGAWTRPVLRAISEAPGTPARLLAERFGVETRLFKQDVRKLKKLGLTRSLEVGYSVSARGRAVLG